MDQDNGAIVPNSAKATDNVNASLYGGGVVAFKRGAVAGLQLPFGPKRAHPLLLSHQNEVEGIDNGAGGATDSEDGGRDGLPETARGCVCFPQCDVDCHGPQLGQQHPSARPRCPLQHQHQQQYSHPEPQCLLTHQRHNHDCPHEDYVNSHAHTHPLPQRAGWATPSSLAPAAWLPANYVCPHSCVTTRVRRDVPSPHPVPPAGSLLQQRHSATLDSQLPHPPGPCPDTMPPGPRCCSLSGNYSPPTHQPGHTGAGESASGANLWPQPPPWPQFLRWPSCETRATLDSRGELPATAAAAAVSAAVAAAAAVSTGAWNGPGPTVMATGSCRADGSPAAIAATAGEETEPPSTPAGAAAAPPLPPPQLGLRFSGSSPSEQPTAAAGCGCCCGGGGGCGGSAEQSVCAGGAASLDPYTVRGLTYSATFEGHAAASEVVTSCNNPPSRSAPAAAAPPPPPTVPGVVIPLPPITTGLPSQCLHHKDLHPAQVQQGPQHSQLKQLHAGAPTSSLTQAVIGSAGRVSNESAGKVSMMHSSVGLGPAATGAAPPPMQEPKDVSMSSQGCFDYVAMWRWSAEAISLAPRAPAAPAAGCHNHGLSPVQGGLNPPCASGSSGPGTGLVQRGSSLTITHANPPACQQLGNVITTGNSIERGLPLVLQSGGDGKLAVVPITGAGSVAAATTPMKMPTSKSHSLLPQTNPLTQQQQVPKVGLSQSVPPRPALAPNAVTTGAGPLQAAAMAFVMGMGGPPNGVGGIGGCSGDEQQQQQWTLFAQRMQPQAQARVLRQVQDQHRTGEGGAEMLAPAMGELADDATSSCGSKDLHARPPAVATSAADSEPALQQLRLQSGEHMKLQQQWQHKHLREHERENGEDDSVEDSEEEEEEEQEEQEQDDDEESEQEKREQDGDEQRRQHEQALLPRKRDHTGGPPPAPVVAKRSRLERLDPVEPQAAPCTIEEAGLPPPSCFHNTDHLAHHHHRQQYQHPHQLAPAGSCEPVVHLSYGSGSGGPTLLPLEGSNGRDACVCGTEGRGPGSGTLALDGHWSIRGDGLTLSIAASSPQLSWGLGCPLQSSGTGAPPLQPLQSADGGTATQLQRIIRGLPSCDGGSGRVRASYWDEMEPTYGSMGVSQEPPPPLPPSSILLLPESERDAMVVAPSTVAMEPQQLQSQPPPPPPPPPPRPTAANMSCTAADSWRRNSSSPHQSLPSQLKSQQQDYRILSPPVGGHVSLPHQIGNMPSDAAMCLGACESIAATSTTLSAPPPSALPVAGLQLPSRSLVTAFPSQRDSQKPQQPHQEAVSHEAFFGNPIGHQHQQSDGQLKHQTLQQQQQQQQQQASGCVRECPCEGSAIAAGCSSSRKRGLEPCDGDGELSGSDSRRSSHTSGGATGAAAPADANTMTATERPNDRLAFQTLQQEVTMQRYPDGVEARPSGGGEGTEFGAVPSTLYGPAPPRRVQNYVPSLSGAVRLEPPWGPPAAPLPSCPPMPVGPGVGNGIPAPQAACPCPACVAQVRHQPSYASAPKPDPVSFSGGAPAGQPPFVSTSAVAPGGGGGGMFSGAGCLPCPCEMCRRADAVMQRNSTAQSLPTTQSSLALPQHQKYHNPCCPAHHPPPPSGAAPAQYAHISTGASFGSSPRGIQLSEHLPYVTSPPPTRAGSFPDVPKGPSVSPYNRAPYTALYASEAGFTATAPACSCPACVVAVSGACTVIAAGVSSAPPAMVPAASSSGAAQRLPPAQPALCEQASTQGGQGPSISPVPGATISPPPLILPESGSTVTAPAPGTAGSSNVMSAATRPSTPWSSSLSLDGTGSSFPALASQHGPAAAGPPPQQTCPQPPASTPPPPAYLRAPLPYSEMYAPRPPETSSLGPHLFPPHPYRHQQQPSAPCQLPEPQLQDLHNISTCARGSGPLQQRNVRHCPALRQPNPRWPQHPLGSYSERQLLDPHALSYTLPHPRYQPAPCTACVSHMGPQEPEQRPQYLGAVGQGASAAKKYDYLRPVNLQTASPAPLKQPAMPPVLPSPNFARSPPITAGTSPSAMAVLSNCTNPSCVGDCTGYNANSSAVTVPLTHGQQPDGTGSSHGTVGRLEAPRKSLCSTPGFDVRGVPLPVLPPRLQSQATAAGATDPGVTMPHRQALQPAPMPRHHPQPSPPESLVERFQSDAAAFAQASAAASPGPVCGICCGCGAPLPVATPTAAADMAGFWQPQPCGAPAVSPITQTMVDGLYPPQAPRVGPSEAAGPVPYPGSLCGEAATRDCAAVLPGALTRGGEHCPSAPPVTEPGCSGTGACKAWSQHPQPHVMSSHYIQQTETPKRGMPPGYLPSPALVATVTTESGQDFSSLDGVDPQMPRFHMAQGSVGAQLTHRSVAPDEEAAMWAEDPISLPWPRRSSRRL